MSESATTPDQPERWLPIAGYDYYEVSDLGRARSLDRVILCRNRWGGVSYRRYRGCVLTPGRNRRGYLYVNLPHDQGGGRMFAVHVLVAEAFLCPRPDGMEVRHGPNGQLDNRASELRWGTPKENNGPDKERDGTLLRGSRSPVAKLTEAAVIDIRARVTAGAVGIQGQLAEEYDVSFSLISQIVRRKIWRHVA